MQVTARDDDVQVPKQGRLKTKIAPSITAVSTTRDVILFEPNRGLVQCQLLPANRIMEVMVNVLFRVLLEKYLVITIMYQNSWQWDSYPTI